MVLQAKPALQGQTKIRKGVFGLKTAIKCFSFPIHGYPGIFLQNWRLDQENHTYLDLKRASENCLWQLLVSIGRKSRLRLGLPAAAGGERVTELGLRTTAS